MTLTNEEWQNITENYSSFYEAAHKEGEIHYLNGDMEKLNDLVAMYSEEVGYRQELEVESWEDFQSELRSIGGYELMEAAK